MKRAERPVLTGSSQTMVTSGLTTAPQNIFLGNITLDDDPDIMNKNSNQMA